MSVVQFAKEDVTAAADRCVCSICDCKLYPPFLCWTDLAICQDCCQKHKRGLMADIIHFAAIADLRDLGYYETFQRAQRRLGNDGKRIREPR